MGRLREGTANGLRCNDEPVVGTGDDPWPQGGSRQTEADARSLRHMLSGRDRGGFAALVSTPVRATLPATDLGQAMHFYGAMLGFAAAIGVGGGVFKGGGGTMLRVYERPRARR